MSGYTVRIQGQDSKSGFRFRIQGQIQSQIRVCVYVFKRGGGLTARTLTASKNSVTAKLGLVDTCRPVVKKKCDCSNHGLTCFKSVLRSHTVRLKMNDCSNHNCLNCNRSSYVKTTTIWLVVHAPQMPNSICQTNNN
jgi:hypothetical protein